MKKSFENPYVINVSGMKIGPNSDDYHVDKTLFEQFPTAVIQDGELDVHLDMHKYGTHLDVKFFFEGSVDVPCDRCLEQYSQPIKSDSRIIYAFDPEMDFEGYDVMHVNPGETRLSLMQEFYDFIQTALPLRLVPDETTHQCSPEVLKYIDTEASPEEASESNDDGPIDPRWEALKKLKFDKEN
ncbi:MAG: DUF177 domain-containing protein [Bacteroidia bacterium]